MNSQITPDPQTGAPAPALTPGGMLRTAREARGVHLGTLAVTLKVPIRQLQALENDEHDAFRGPAFVRAVALAVCRHLRIDPVPVLAGLPQVAKTIQMAPTRIESSVPAPSREIRGQPGARVSRQVLLLAVLMLAGVAALLGWPALKLQFFPDEEVAAASSGGAAAVDGATPVVAQPAADASATVQPPAMANTAVAATAELMIAAIGDTWLEVRDASGQLVINRLLMAGEVQAVDLPAPFSVVVGRAHMVKVTRRGKDFDLTPHTKLTTARFEVLP